MSIAPPVLKLRLLQVSEDAPQDRVLQYIHSDTMFSEEQRLFPDSALLLLHNEDRLGFEYTLSGWQIRNFVESSIVSLNAVTLPMGASSQFIKAQDTISVGGTEFFVELETLNSDIASSIPQLSPEQSLLEESVEIEALERELLSVLNQQSNQVSDDAEKHPRAIDEEDEGLSDDVLVQLAIESELAINSPQTLQQRKKSDVSQDAKKVQELKHLKELDTLLGSRISTDSRNLSLNQSQEFEGFFNSHTSIDKILDSVVPDYGSEQLDSAALQSEETIDPLKLFQLGSKPVVHNDTDLKLTPHLAQQEQYQSSLDSVLSVPSSKIHAHLSTDRHLDAKQDDSERESILFDDLYEAEEDILNSLLNGEK